MMGVATGMQSSKNVVGLLIYKDVCFQMEIPVVSLYLKTGHVLYSSGYCCSWLHAKANMDNVNFLVEYSQLVNVLPIQCGR